MPRPLLALALTLPVLAGCRSSTHHVWPRRVHHPRKKLSNDYHQLRRAYRKAKTQRRPGLAINALKAVEAELPNARLRGSQRKRLHRWIDRALQKQLGKPIPLETALIDLALAHPPAAKATKLGARLIGNPDGAALLARPRRRARQVAFVPLGQEVVVLRLVRRGWARVRYRNQRGRRRYGYVRRAALGPRPLTLTRR